MSFTRGTRLGPYEILAPLGAGGMGEVYRALDPRLGREVAIKVLPGDLVMDPDRLRRFEKEARAVGALNHPNVLIVHDVGSHGGAPYVVTELLEGETLREILLRRSPTPRQVLSWVAQAAEGLSAAHQKGIVHRDVKPENLFLTTDGRLKVLDFGLAKLVARPAPETEAATASRSSEAGVVMGTVPYMSPEQVRAEALDPRTDLFSLGVVLYELLSGEHPFRRQTVPATLTAIVTETPRPLSGREAALSSSVERVVSRCLEKRREERFQSAHDLALVLRDLLEGRPVSTALAEVEERDPYPGLAIFGEEDAGHFFGREAETEELWRRLQQRRLLAVIGPSGAGKSSFVRAGVVAARPQGWSAIVVTPGSAPLRALGQALAPELAHDPEALRRLVTFEEGDTSFELLVRWRKARDETLVVIDQLEELFTLNPPETQARFAALLGRLAGEGDVHVLLSLRDDFLMRCHELAPLSPVFEALTPLGPMGGESLRRALIEPAARRGYRFEDDELVDEMVAAVEGGRGTLPLLAFAVARLWEKRSPGSKLLTREAYREIDGVTGALARHAEETLERIGAARERTARDLFRNLTTAHGTRAVLEREELLTAMPDRGEAEAVLGKLVDARLLTTWETEAGDGRAPRQLVEIVHESLLTAWPRLVRWETQDADGAQLRDQLRQAAHLWQERGRPEDLLWTGASYLDYRAWRARYPGKLSSLEDEFASSMTARTDRARRRRRIAAGALVAALVIGLGVVAGLWRRSEAQRVRAEAASRRAEASKLLAMAQLEVDADPAAALAYATKSVDLDDTRDARLVALRVLQDAPVASFVTRVAKYQWFSPDGDWLALIQDKKIRLLGEDGRERGPYEIPGEHPKGSFLGLGFPPDGKNVCAGFRNELVSLSIADGRVVGRWSYEQAADEWCRDCGTAARKEGPRLVLFVRPWDGGAERALGVLDASGMTGGPEVDLAHSVVAWAAGRKLYARSPARWATPPRLLGEHPADVTMISISADGGRLAAVDTSGDIRVWDTSSSSGRPVRVLPAPAVRGPSGINAVWYFPRGGWIWSDTGGEGHAVMRLWDLRGPPGASPLVLRTKATQFHSGAMEPHDRGFVVRDASGQLLYWPLPSSRPRLFELREGQIASVAFTADGETLVAGTNQGDLRAWPLSADAPEACRILPKSNRTPGKIAAHPTRPEIAVGSRGRLQVMAVDGGPARNLEGLPGASWVWAIAYSPDGSELAAAPLFGPIKEKSIHVWDLETGNLTQVLPPVPGADTDEKSWDGGFLRLSFVDRDRIVAVVAGKGKGLMLFDRRDATSRVLAPAFNDELSVGRSGRAGVGLAWSSKSSSGEIFRFGVDGKPPERLPYRAEGGEAVAVSPDGTLVASAGPDESIQVGPISGGEPHLLFGHRGLINALAFSPDGKWLASGGDDQTVRLWPVPDVSRVPPHRRSKDDFLATLRTFTNVRAVPDPGTRSGWKLEAEPFPGWRTPPHW